MSPSFPDFFYNFFYILGGLGTTLSLAVYGIALGFIIAFPVAAIRVYGGENAKSFVSIYERTLRSVPLLVVMFIMYFGVAQVGLPIPAFQSVGISLGLCSSAYQSQIIRGAIESIGGGQMDAATSTGMSRLQAIRYVITPQALRLALPSWINEAAIVTKDTSYSFVLGIADIMRRADYVRSVTYNALVPYLIVAAVYFALIFPLTFILGGWIRKQTGIMMGRQRS